MSFFFVCFWGGGGVCQSDIGNASVLPVHMIIINIIVIIKVILVVIIVVVVVIIVAIVVEVLVIIFLLTRLIWIQGFCFISNQHLCNKYTSHKHLCTCAV